MPQLYTFNLEYEAIMFLENNYITTLENLIKYKNEMTNGRKTVRNGAPVCFKYLTKPFPALTCKYVYWKMAINEMMGYLRGYTDAADFSSKLGVSTWLADAAKKEWQDTYATSKTDMGRVYGAQFRSWKTPDGLEIDQFAEIIYKLINDRYDRRLVMSGWNVGELGLGCLAPCMFLYTFTLVRNTLHLSVTQRSGDMCLGVPFNFIQTAFLLKLVCLLTKKNPGTILHTISDPHVYDEHILEAEDMCSGWRMSNTFQDRKALPELVIATSTWPSIWAMKDVPYVDVKDELDEIINNLSANNCLMANYHKDKLTTHKFPLIV